MGKLDHVKDTVVKSLAVGEPQTSIAEQVGVDQSTISPVISLCILMYQFPLDFGTYQSIINPRISTFY